MAVLGLTDPAEGDWGRLRGLQYSSLARNTVARGLAHGIAALGVVARRRGRWETFQPSQTPLGCLVVREGIGLVEVLDAIGRGVPALALAAAASLAPSPRRTTPWVAFLAGLCALLIVALAVMWWRLAPGQVRRFWFSSASALPTRKKASTARPT